MPLISSNPEATTSAVKTRFGYHQNQQSGSSDSAMKLMKTSSYPCLLLESAAGDNSFLQSSHEDNSSNPNDGGTALHGGARTFEFQEDPSFWKENNVQVIIRVRPLSSSEISLQGNNKCVKQDSSQSITWTGHPESRFTFDLVADENFSQEMLFKVAGVPMVENCMEGYNSCMFAYGQTGSGKTHTMLGDIEGGARRHSVNCGMTPRVFEFLFSRIQKDKDARRDEKLKFTCRCSFLEIYNEQILDLLDPSSINLQLREDSKKGVYVENLTEVEVTSARDVIQHLIQGAANRKVASTNMNHASSRSHSVFTCIIESKWESQGVTHHRFARLNLVDLAGSERQKSSGAEGERLKEATNINKSLSTLGLVIMNLVSVSNGKSQHVPYRDSKLTFLLQVNDSVLDHHECWQASQIAIAYSLSVIYLGILQFHKHKIHWVEMPKQLSSRTLVLLVGQHSSLSELLHNCSLETLSTLKFAQRAKFIKNHAIVNEDASGDVLALRIENQNLKLRQFYLDSLELHFLSVKSMSCDSTLTIDSIAQLHIMGCQFDTVESSVNGGVASHDGDVLSLAFPGSPGSFKWDGLHGLSSPLMSEKKMPHKKEYEVALVGAFRREKDKDTALQALAAENQAALQLAKQREDEIQGLKMRLRFREAGIKRLEAVASGKISAEIHLLKEKEEYLKEIEVLRAQVDRNQELLETLDWKLMHESDPANVQVLIFARNWFFVDEILKLNSIFSLITQKGSPNIVMDIQSDDNFLSNQESASPWRTTINEENEFLRIQAIQNQSELDSLRKKLDYCIEEKEKLERHVSDMAKELEAERLSKEVIAEQLQNRQSDQTEIKTMVDAIAAASHREAKAHETAILLSKENDELRMKLKVLVEDNNKLIDLYETAIAENSRKSCEHSLNPPENSNEDHNFTEVAEEKKLEMKREFESLNHQLAEMHEENDKLLSLYEKAMQERDELKKVIASGQRKSESNKGDFSCLEKLVEIDEGQQCLRFDEDSISFDDEFGRKAMGSLGPYIRNDKNDLDLEGHSITITESLLEETSLYEVDVQDVYGHYSVDSPKSNYADLNEANKQMCKDLDTLRKKLVEAQEKLSYSAKTINTFSALERALVEVDALSEEIAKMENGIQAKQQEYAYLKSLSSELQERKDVANKKLSALKHSLTSFSSSVCYFEHREDLVRSRLNVSSQHLIQRKEELANLHVSKKELMDSLSKFKQTETELKNNLEKLRSKMEEENKKLESDNRVLFATIDNVEKEKTATDLPQRNWQMSGKATELLKSEEEKTKLQNQIKINREKLGDVRKDAETVTGKLSKMDTEIKVLEMELQKEEMSVQEMEWKLQSIIQDKEMLLEINENGKNELETMIVEYHQSLFEADLKEEEVKTMDEEIFTELRKMEGLKKAKGEALRRKAELIEAMSCNSCFVVSEKMEADFHDIQRLVAELNFFV
ncbi:hypothetical protein DH2020_024352 [Rehmannia glutinosa]|uniref:Kinesin motor domain-containing protein n=1 Tax=Rehmannia glutinosa TaxID=99300 RepID=A0ABR0W560_REHGL